MKDRKPGELIQIDHMSVRKNNLSFKHFKAWDPVTKIIFATLTSDATSAGASKFLDKLIKYLPYSIKSIQVDGGSEFMKHFEDKCQQYNLELFVIPPAKPQYNGGVERGNRIFGEGFYSNDYKC